ncbi:hypothetical protein BT69DRAFT_1330427 [Atractiella rhizophila]|nr:hypothetical protein BT69DRAFT_1330427 [Atractiella rhizophila]
MPHPLCPVLHHIFRLFISGHIHILQTPLSPSSYYHINFHDPSLPHASQWNSVVIDLRNIALVCRSWRDTVLPLLWHSICLKKYSAALTFNTFLFIHSARLKDAANGLTDGSISPPLRWIRHLKVLFHDFKPLKAMNERKKRMYDPIKLVADVIGELQLLEFLNIGARFAEGLEGKEEMRRLLRNIDSGKLKELKKLELSLCRHSNGAAEPEPPVFSLPLGIALVLLSHRSLVTLSCQVLDLSLIESSINVDPGMQKETNSLRTLELLNVRLPSSLFPLLFTPHRCGLSELYMASCSGYSLQAIIPLLRPSPTLSAIPIRVLVLDDWDPVLSLCLANTGTQERPLPSLFETSFLPLLRIAPRLEVLKLFSTDGEFPMAKMLDAIVSTNLTTLSINSPSRIDLTALYKHLRSDRFAKLQDWGITFLDPAIHPGRGAPTWELLECAHWCVDNEKEISFSFDNGDDYWNASDVVQKLESTGRLISQELFDIDWSILLGETEQET